TGGAVGYIGYDAIRAFAPIGKELEDELEMPDVHFMLFENLIIYEHFNDTVSIIATNVNNEAEAILDERIQNLERALDASLIKQDMEDFTVKFSPDISKE